MRTSHMVAGLLLVSACVTDSKDQPEVNVEVDALGSADAAGPYQGEVTLDETVERSLSPSNWYHVWSVDLETDSSVSIDLASRDGDDTYLVLYEQRSDRWSVAHRNDDCRDSLNSCLEVDLDAGSYLILATTYDALYGRPGRATYQLTAYCLSCEPTSDVPAVQVVDTLPDAGDAVTFERAELDGNILNLRVRYSGGCAEHEFDLYWDGSVMESLPPQVRVLLTHNANGDLCRALPAQELSFDVSEIVAADPSVVISIRGAGDEITAVNATP